MALRHEFRKQGDLLFRYRSYLPIIIILAGLAVYIVRRREEIAGGFEQIPLKWELCFLAIALLGLLIRVMAVGQSADNTSGRNTEEGQIADDVNTTGWYSVCRHPLYLGNFFMWLGIAAFTRNFWFLIAFIFLYYLYYERIMYAEEEFLLDKYGKPYASWASKVSAFIPKFSDWKKSTLPFSWVKVIRQEKAGILNLFLVILIFKAIDSYLISGGLSSVSRFWLYAFLGSVLWYLIIKILQKTTKILEYDRK